MLYFRAYEVQPDRCAITAKAKDKIGNYRIVKETFLSEFELTALGGPSC